MSDQTYNTPFVWEKPEVTRKYSLKEGQKVIDYNLILTGLPEDIDEVVRALPDSKIGATPLQTLDLSIYLPSSLTSQVPALQVFQPLQVRLYEFSPEKESEETVWATIQQIYAQAASQGKIVFADPNYITGDPEGGSGGSGAIVGGPEGGSGGSGAIVGGPEGGSGGSGAVVGGPVGNVGSKTADEAFIKHWAFYTENGINLEAGTGIRINARNKGQSAEVYIFDTVDERLSREINRLANAPDQPHPNHFFRIQRTYPPEPLEFYVSSPASRFYGSSLRPIHIQSVLGRNVDEHGLFVAGLIHRIAPQCKIHLVDVLNEQGQGELFGLLYALMQLAKRGAERASKETPEPLNHAVVNLSLGITLSKKTMDQAQVPQTLKAMKTASLTSATAPNYLLMTLLDDMVYESAYIGSMRVVTRLLAEMGAYLIAAAGNDSTNVIGDLPPQIPARYAEVIGVAASIKKGIKATYSNRGDVVAPGGGSDLLDVTPNNPQTLADLQIDKTEYSVVSVIPKLSAQDAGLGLWSGTSFAAPMVSGLVALMIERMQDRQQMFSLQDIKEMLANRARNGIVDVQMALDGV